ncbi:glycosyltransferase family 4 protein [Pelagovum pacificum]|uniref:Glycosyltransferase family 4 protein n=1 Tax=Pelagovum pacificum TaxID=2588711 RepID=A0A5C5GDR7_9RHOB|nr:glycosyltransferase family 4 protein [Pelagovum pacificum]QQA44725.1 glycosyltransferase family 4 protein [Pelagovum pacificum]TNY32167.1 glycosyltransferase family 4 protein [Pelagovum pacificum]
MSLPRVLHLVDDTTAGGVMRVIEHIRTSPDLARSARHDVLSVTRGALRWERLGADVIVSHLAVSWRSLPALALLRARHPRTPLVHVEHSYTEAFVAENVPSSRRFHLLLRTAFALFDRVVAVSEAQGRWLTTRRLVSAGRLAVIRSCVDLTRFRQLAQPAGRVGVIGAIGRLDRQKGFDLLIEAFRQVDDASLELRIIGEGPELGALRDLAAGDPRIRFMGFAADPAAAMADIDAVVMPSRWEAYGIVAIEALAARRPLLVNRVDGLIDHLELGAIPVGANSVVAWRDAISSLSVSGEASSYRASEMLEKTFTSRWATLVGDLVRLTPSGARTSGRECSFAGCPPT